VLLVDAANVVGSRPNGWWRDRPGAARSLVERIRAATADARLEAPVVVVLEGAARRGVEEGTAGGVAVLHAPGEGDETLAQVASTADEQVVLVSADRALADRCRRAGSDVVGPGWLLDRLGP
jgi:rRNA-processing protein FCF1